MPGSAGGCLQKTFGSNVCLIAMPDTTHGLYRTRRRRRATLADRDLSSWLALD